MRNGRDYIDRAPPLGQSLGKKEITDIVSVRVKFRIEKSPVIDSEDSANHQQRDDVKDEFPFDLIFSRDILFRC